MTNEFTPWQQHPQDKEFNVWVMDKSPAAESEEPISAADLRDAELERQRQESIAAGYQEGLERGQAEINQLRSELEQTLLILQQPVRMVDEQLVSEMMQTMLWLAESCIGIEISQQQDKLQGLLKTILEQWGEIAGSKSLMMHPEDLDWIKTQLQSSRHQDLLENLHPEASLNRGDFYIKSEHMELDGRLQSRLSQLFAEYL